MGRKRTEIPEKLLKRMALEKERGTSWDALSKEYEIPVMIMRRHLKAYMDSPQYQPWDMGKARLPATLQATQPKPVPPPINQEDYDAAALGSTLPDLPCFEVPPALDADTDKYVLLEAARTSLGLMSSCRASMAIHATNPKAMLQVATVLKTALSIYVGARSIGMEPGRAPIMPEDEVQSDESGTVIYFRDGPRIEDIPEEARAAINALKEIQDAA